MKLCKYCSEQILDSARKCKHCGEYLDDTLRRGNSSGIAALLSVIIPGAGQIYKGQVFNGIAWMLFVIGGYVCFIMPGIILHILCVVGASMKS